MDNRKYNTLESTALNASAPVASIKQIYQKLVFDNNRDLSSSVHLTQDIISADTITIPVGQSLHIDLRNFKLSVSFNVLGELNISNGELLQPIAGTGIINCRDIDFTGATSAATGPISNSQFINCLYPTTFTTGVVTHTVISGKMTSVEAELVVGSAVNTPVAIKVDLAGGLNCFSPDDSNINVTGDYTNVSSLGTQTNIFARNIVSTPAVPAVDLSPLRLTEYEHKTNNYTVTYDDTNKWFTNLGATDLVVFTLPAATSDGYLFSFFVDGYFGIQIAKSEPTDVIFIDGWINDDSAGKTWTSYTPGDWVTLTAWDTYTWNAISSSGTPPNSITNDLIRDSAGLSVIGRASNSTGDPADIVADTDNTVLRRSGTSIGFGTIPQSAVTNLTTDLAAKLPTIASSTDLSIARWDGSSGNLLQGSAVTISDLGEIAGGRSPTVSYTSNQTLIAAQSGTIFTNKDATGQVDLTLPIPSAGLEYYFHVDTSQLLRIKPNISGANYLMVDGYLTVDYFESNTVGDFLYLYAIDSNGWQGFSDGTLNGNKGDLTISDYQRQWTINNNAISYGKIQQMSGLSVLGNATNSTANAGEITASSDNTYLRRNGTILEFGALPVSADTHYVDYANLAAFPITGATDLIYLALDTAKIYYWDGAAYQEISPSAAAVSSVFGRTGVVTAATNDYTWAQIDKTTSSLTDITTRNHSDLSGVGTNSHSTIDSHLASTSNPHSVTKSQILTGNLIVDADVDASSAIATSKLQNISSARLLGRDSIGTGAIQQIALAAPLEFTGTGGIQIATGGITSSHIANGTIVNEDISASAAIDLSKLSVLTADRVLISNGSGVISADAAVTATELSYLDGVTSGIQTQIDGKVAGPASSVDNTLPRYDSTSGKLIQTSSVVVDDNNAMFGQHIKISDKSADYTVLASESGTKFTNRAATAEVEFTLPNLTTALTSAHELYYTFHVIESVGIKITCGNAENWIVGLDQISSALGGSIQLTAVDDCITIVSETDGYQWSCISSVGKSEILANSVLGRAGATAGIPAPIQATVSDTFLKFDGTDLIFAAVPGGISDHTALTSIGTNTHSDIDNHIASTSNPHSVTKSQILTGNLIVDADIDNAAGIATSKLQNLSSARLLGRDSIGSGAIQQIALAAPLQFTGTGGLEIAAGGITSTHIANGAIVNEDINASAVIDFSKLAILTSGNILIGNGSNVATSTAVSGDVSISNTGVTAIVSGVVVNGDINASAGINYSKMETIAANSVLGRASNSTGVAAPIAATVANTFLKYDGTDLVWDSTGAGTGDVVGPSSATDNAICRFDLTTGKLIQNSTVTIDNSGNFAGAKSIAGATGFDFQLGADSTYAIKLNVGAFNQWVIDGSYLQGSTVTYTSNVPRIRSATNTATDVAYGWTAETGLGISRITTGEFGLYAGGVQQMKINSSGLSGDSSNSYTPLIPKGTDSSTALLYTSLDDPDSGIGLPGSNIINFVSGGSMRSTIDSTGYKGDGSAFQPLIRHNSASTISPIFSAVNDDDTGINFIGSDTIAFISNANKVWSITTDKLVGDTASDVCTSINAKAANDGVVYGASECADTGICFNATYNELVIKADNFNNARFAGNQINLNATDVYLTGAITLTGATIVDGASEFTKNIDYAQASSSTDGNIVVSAADYSSIAWLANFTTSNRTIQISYLTAGRRMRIGIRNTNSSATEPNIYLECSTTNSGYTAVDLCDGDNVANSPYCQVQNGNNRYIEVENFGGTFIAFYR